MATRTVRAVRHQDGHLALLDPVDLPAEPIMITLELPPEDGKREKVELPIRNLGPFKGKLTREEIYEDVVRGGDL